MTLCVWRPLARARRDQLKIGYAKRPFDVTAHDAEVDKAMDIAIQGLKDAGHELIEMPFAHAEDAARLWGDMLFTETMTFLDGAVREYGSEGMNTLLENYANYFDLMDLEGFLKPCNLSTWCAGFYLMPTSLIRPFENDFDFKYPDKILTPRNRFSLSIFSTILLAKHR